MALLPLNWDVVNKRLVLSESNPRQFVLPELNQEDGLTIEFRALKRIRDTSMPFFERIALSGYDLLITIGTAGSIDASANSWTPSDGNTLLSGTLSLNTAQISALTDGTERLFEIRLFDGINYYRGQQTCRIRKSVAIAGVLVPIPGDTALGALEASRVYVRKEGRAGEAIILTSQDGTKQGILYWHDDGSFRAEPIT